MSRDFVDTRDTGSIYYNACEDARNSPRYSGTGASLSCQRTYILDWTRPGDDGALISQEDKIIGDALGYVSATNTRKPPDNDRKFFWLYCTRVSLEPRAIKATRPDKSALYHKCAATLVYEAVPYYVSTAGADAGQFVSSTVRPSAVSNVTYNGVVEFVGPPTKSVYAGIQYLTIQKEYIITKHQVALSALVGGNRSAIFNEAAVNARLGKVNSDDNVTIETPSEKIVADEGQLLLAGIEKGKTYCNVAGVFVCDIAFRILYREQTFDKLLDKKGTFSPVQRDAPGGKKKGLYDRAVFQTLFPQAP